MEQTMLEGFERFTKKGRSFKSRITIRNRGHIGFNNGSVLRFELDKYEYVVLYYSKEKNQIAVQLTNNKNEEGAIKLVKKPGNYFFSGKAFLDFYRIDYAKTKSYDLESLNSQLVVINLGKEDVV